MTPMLCYTTTPLERAVLYLDGQSVTPRQSARARIYEAWRAYAGEPALPMTPLRHGSRTQRAGVLPAFPCLLAGAPKT